MDILREAVRTLGSERVLFGTDWPYKPTNIEVDKIFELDLSDRQLEDVLHRNAERIWNGATA